MSSFALLVSPSANRVYAHSAPSLTVAELGVLDATVLGGRLGTAEPTEIAGVPYVTFSGDLTDADLRHVANVSTAFALFERDGEALRPVTLHRLDCLDDDLLTILKYQGKTNEVFTKLLLNVAAASSASGRRMLTDRLRVLDPMCGRGTTLNQALMYGWHACGLDVDERDFDAYAAFLPRWLKDKRLKHSADSARLRREGRTVGRRFDARFALVEGGLGGRGRHPGRCPAGRHPGGGRPAQGPQHRRDRHRRAVRRAARQPVGRRSAPQPARPARRGAARLGEGAPAGGRGRRSRSTCAPARAADLLALLAEAGLEPLDDPAYRGFEHRVDQAILRDVVVGVQAVRDAAGEERS